MRTRNRTVPLPPDGCNVDTPYGDSFTDEPIGRGWKPASRRTARALDSQQIRVDYETYYAGVWTKAYRLSRPFEWDGSLDIRYGAKILPNKVSGNNFPKVDLVALAMERSRSDLFVLEFLRTAGETLSMIKRPWKFLRHLKSTGSIPYRSYNRPLRDLKASIDRAGSTWLEGTYGYIPLIHDLVSIGKMCRNPQEVLTTAANQPCVTDIRQRYNVTSEYLPVDISDPWYDRRLLVRSTEVHSGKRLVRLRWIYNPSFGSMTLANQMAMYLGLGDFGRAAYEAMKFSFVLDWFTSFGSRIANNPALNGPVMWLVSPTTMVSESRTVTSFYGKPFLKAEIPDSPYNRRNQRITGGYATTKVETFNRFTVASSSIDSYVQGTGLTAYRTTTGTFLGLGELNRLIRNFR